MGDRGDEGGRTNEESSAPALAYVTPEAALERGLPQDVEWLRKVAWGWGIIAAVALGTLGWLLVQAFRIRFNTWPVPRRQFDSAVAWLLIGGDLLGIWWATAHEGEGRRRWPMASAVRACAVVATGLAVAERLWWMSRRTTVYSEFELVRQAVAMATEVLLFTYLVALARAARDRRLGAIGKVLRIACAAGVAWCAGLPWLSDLTGRLGWTWISMWMLPLLRLPGVTVVVYVFVEVATAAAGVWAAVRVNAAKPPMARTET